MSRQLHALVYLALGVAALWFALAAWSFADSGYTDWLLAVVSIFAFIAIAIPVILWRTGARHGRCLDDTRQNAPSFRDWAEREFATWQDSTRGKNAAVEVLLPLAAIAVGMTAIAAVFLLTAHAG